MHFFDTYAIVHLSNHPTFDAQIACYSKDDIVGVLVFVKGGIHPLPANENGTPPTVYFPASRFNDVITTLRYEKPVMFNFNTENLVGTVETGREPVGEQEAQ